MRQISRETDTRFRNWGGGGGESSVALWLKFRFSCHDAVSWEQASQDFLRHIGLIYSSRNDAVSSSDYTVSNGRMSTEPWLLKTWKWTMTHISGFIQVLPLQALRTLEEHQDSSQSANSDSNLRPTDYEEEFPKSLLSYLASNNTTSTANT
jgi:hypothetical protein